MFGWLLTKPAIILDFVLLGILIVSGLYFFYSQHEITTLNRKVIEQKIQASQDATTIKDLNNRLELVQELNDNFNKAVNSINEQQASTIKALNEFNLKLQSSKTPRKAEEFINSRNKNLFDDLNNLSRGTARPSK